jgi:catechol 2,3-dioxygenase-like lactoylglutathione lyase family enzyme
MGCGPQEEARLAVSRRSTARLSCCVEPRILTCRRPFTAPPDLTNAPGSPPQRPVNALEITPDMEVIPRTLSYVVLFVPDVARAEAFYSRLGFRTTDRFIDVGPFMRPAGTLDHHTLFLIQAPAFMKGLPCQVEQGWVWACPMVHSGRNELDVRVANLWVNRLIGDAQPNATQITFTTLPSYRADAPLRPSGLIGPVRLLREQRGTQH